MSTNPKDLKAKDASEALIAKHKRSIDQSVRTLMQAMEHENTLLPEPPISRLQRVLKIYRQIKPLLALLGSLPFVPYNWRSPLLMFTQALDALAAVGPELTAQFKAGRDL
jgi:hypothetical protein